MVILLSIIFSPINKSQGQEEGYGCVCVIPGFKIEVITTVGKTEEEAITACTNRGGKPGDCSKVAKAIEAEEANCVEEGSKTERGIFTEGLSDKCVGCGKCGQCDVLTVVSNSVQFIFSIVGPLAVLVVILAGFLYITAGESEERAGKAKGALVAAAVGVLIVLLAWVLVNFIIATLNPPKHGERKVRIFDEAWWQPTCKNI